MSTATASTTRTSRCRLQPRARAARSREPGRGARRLRAGARDRRGHLRAGSPGRGAGHQQPRRRAARPRRSRGARANFARVPKIRRGRPNPDHPAAVAIGCSNLGSVLQALGERPGRASSWSARSASRRLTRTVRITRSWRGIVNNLGRVLQALGDLVGRVAADRGAPWRSPRRP